MSPEALVLGLLSAVRTTPLAIVYGFLLSNEPRRLLVAYIVGGAVVSLALGLAVVSWFEVSAPSSEPATLRQLIDLLLGLGALGYTAFYAARATPARTSRRAGLDAGKLIERLRHPSASLAATSGALTNLPGLFYLAGLVAILQTDPSPANAAFQVALYNALRFAAPLAALVAVTFAPSRTRVLTDAAFGWGQRHRRRIVVVVLGGVGIFLVIKGALGLFS